LIANGTVALKLMVNDLNGKAVRLVDFAHKVVVIDY
jgi:hypothetical protein